ncbi:MAG: addiction module protein [Pirellulales bacterium]
MSLDFNSLLTLPDSEKLRLVEHLWDDLGQSKAPIPLPEWAIREAARRREEMLDPAVGRSQQEIWQGIHVRQ